MRGEKHIDVDHTFTLIVEDNDTRLLNSTDRVHLSVYNSSGVLIYDTSERVSVGMVGIYRQ